MGRGRRRWKVRVFKHQSHTAVEIKPWKRGSFGAVFIIMKSRIPFFPIRECRVNWKVHRDYILLPFFRFENNNCEFCIGMPRAYLTIYK